MYLIGTVLYLARSSFSFKGFQVIFGSHSCSGRSFAKWTRLARLGSGSDAAGCGHFGGYHYRFPGVCDAAFSGRAKPYRQFVPGGFLSSD